jgi:glycolate oxidase FAD binding subunit
LPTGSELIEHEPGDLTCVVEAGMRLSALQERLGREGQMLAIDPPGDPTVGELVDGNLSGPRRHRYGAPRDLVIGMTVRLADGTVSSSGGKVVKNVAGYDLGKLFCGARGAFGEVLRVAVRLHPKPPAEATVAVDFATPADGHRLAQAVLRSQLVPSAVDILVSEPTLSRLGVGSESAQSQLRVSSESAQRRKGQLAVLFEGSERAVAAQVATALALVGGSEDASVWGDIARQQAAAGGRVAFDRVDTFLAQTTQAVVRVAALNAYVPAPVTAAALSPLAERIRLELA